MAYVKLADMQDKRTENGGNVVVLDPRPDKSPKPRKPERWIDIGGNQLKLAADTRPGKPYRLVRVDLYSKDRKTVIASFYRRTAK